MRKTLSFAIALASLAAASAIHAATPVSTNAPRVSGAWRLVETRQRLVDGSSRTDPDLGAHPSGYMIYDPSGQMCTVFSDSDRPAPLTPLAASTMASGRTRPERTAGARARMAAVE